MALKLIRTTHPDTNELLIYPYEDDTVIIVRVETIRGQRAQLTIDAPEEIEVLRGELVSEYESQA